MQCYCGWSLGQSMLDETLMSTPGTNGCRETPGTFPHATQTLPLNASTNRGSNSTCCTKKCARRPNHAPATGNSAERSEAPSSTTTHFAGERRVAPARSAEPGVRVPEYGRLTARQSGFLVDSMIFAGYIHTKNDVFYNRQQPK